MIQTWHMSTTRSLRDWDGVRLLYKRKVHLMCETHRFNVEGSVQVLHHLNAARARCAVITLDTPGANYRAVWAMNKHYPNAKIYVRAHDVGHGINLEKAGATAGAHLTVPCAAAR